MSDLLEDAKEKIQELVSRAEEVAEEAENYLAVATEIDNRKKARDPRDYVPLDDLPFGEECIRLDGVPDALRALADNLQTVNLETISVSNFSQLLDDAEEHINDAKSTIDDCSELPSQDGEDDDDGFPGL
jgi:hypothetical protein